MKELKELNPTCLNLTKQYLKGAATAVTRCTVIVRHAMGVKKRDVANVCMRQSVEVKLNIAISLVVRPMSVWTATFVNTGLGRSTVSLV